MEHVEGVMDKVKEYVEGFMDKNGHSTGYIRNKIKFKMCSCISFMYLLSDVSSQYLLS